MSKTDDSTNTGTFEIKRSAEGCVLLPDGEELPENFVTVIEVLKLHSDWLDEIPDLALMAAASAGAKYMLAMLREQGQLTADADCLLQQPPTEH